MFNLNFFFYHSFLGHDLMFSFSPGILAGSFNLAVIALLFMNPHWPRVCSVDIQARAKSLVAQIQFCAASDTVCIGESCYWCLR